MYNSSGDYAIAFSTAYNIPYNSVKPTNKVPPLLNNEEMTAMFRAVEEATQEAIYNSLCMATTVSGYQEHTREAIPLDQVVKLLKKYIHKIR